MSCALVLDESEGEDVVEFSHEPVLLREVIALAQQAGARRLVDCTVGGAGHSTALLEALPDATLLALDRDPTAVATARERLARFGDRARVEHARFSTVAEVVAGVGGGTADFILADLGVSSHQLDEGTRGFSFRTDAPLDMRMDSTQGESAGELIECASEGELARLIADFGEERFARRIAGAIKRERPKTTLALAELVRSVVPAHGERIHPATRTFQALRMAVNHELPELEALLAAVPALLAPSGIAAIISFHSLEDRAVKDSFREQSTRRPRGNKFLPEAVLPLPEYELLSAKPITAADDELETNPRSRSAKMRAVRKLGPREGSS